MVVRVRAQAALRAHEPFGRGLVAFQLPVKPSYCDRRDFAPIGLTKGVHMHHVHPPGIEEGTLGVVVPHCLEALDGAPEGGVIPRIAGDIQHRLIQLGAEFGVSAKP